MIDKPRFNLSMKMPEGNIDFCWLDKVDPAIWRLVYRKIIKQYVGDIATPHKLDTMIADITQFIDMLVNSKQIYRWPDRWQFSRHVDPSYLCIDGFKVGCLVRPRPDTVRRARIETKCLDVASAGVFLGWVDHVSCMVYLHGAPKQVEADLIEPAD